MKILYLITKSEFGGAQTHVYQLCEYAIRRGNTVAVMSYPGGWLEQKVEQLGIPFYPNPFFVNSLNPFTWFRAHTLMKKAVQDFSPDIISCHGSFAGMIGRVTIRNRIPTIFTVHGWGFTVGIPLFRRLGVLLIECLSARYVEKIVCVSEYDKNLARRYRIAPARKLVCIYNGVGISTMERKRQEKLPGDAVTIVFVGRLVAPKDPLLLIEAISSLPPSFKRKVEVFIIGEGRKRKEAEELIKQKNLQGIIHLTGGLPLQEVFEYLKSSDIFILLSNWEGLPYSVLEAMSFGLPVIATDVGGVGEAVGKECGILVKRGDKQGVVKALVTLIGDESLRRSMGEEGRKRAQENFSLERMLSQTEELYLEVLSH